MFFLHSGVATLNVWCLAGLIFPIRVSFAWIAPNMDDCCMECLTGGASRPKYGY